MCFRWASQGLEFLCVACEPRVMATLTEEQFMVMSTLLIFHFQYVFSDTLSDVKIISHIVLQGLKKCINQCITHVVGDKGTAGCLSPGFRVSSPDLSVQKHHMLRHTSMPDTRPTKTYPLRNIHSEPPTPIGHHHMDGESMVLDWQGLAHFHMCLCKYVQPHML